MGSKKQALLEAATVLFATKGFRDTSMAELAKLTGTAGGTVFYHYKTKEDLYLAVLENVKELLVEEFDTYFREKAFPSGLDMMEGVIGFYLYQAGIHEFRFRLLHRHHPYDLAQVNPVCRQMLEEIYNCLTDIFERAIVIGKQDGSIVDSANRKTALIIFSMVDGVVRLNTYNLYHAATLINELIAATRRMLTSHPV
ncbi:MAG: TetR/AcrR family transcriptional regulator [Desulfobacterales bacterium]|jgi:AcrR family transcriptional regulator|nr:TetR/AcrR family transcriptional regulator [Desulfobacterales bacterium]